MCCVAFQFTGDQVAGNDATAFPIDDDHIHHLMAGEHLHLTLRNLTTQSGVCAQQKLLTGLAFGIKCSRDLHPTEAAVVEQAAIFAGKRNPLGHALVNDAG